MKYDTEADKDVEFSIDQALNDNWDKIDNAVGTCNDVIDKLDSAVSACKVDIAEVSRDVSNKQDKLRAGENISIENNVISSKSFSGEYDDLTGKPTKLSDFQNDIGLGGGFVEGRDYDVIE